MNENTPNTITTADLHQVLHAKEMSQFAVDAYQDDDKHDSSAIPAGSKRLTGLELRLLGISPKRLHNPDSGFNAAIYKTQSGQYVLAFRGTDDFTQDWITNLSSTIGVITDQYEEAYNLAADLVSKVGRDNVEVTGVSLGGGLSNYVALRLNIPSTTFNPKGASLTERQEIPDLDTKAQRLINNYRVDGEILTRLQEAPFFTKLNNALKNLENISATEIKDFYLNAPGNNHTMPAVKGMNPFYSEDSIRQYFSQLPALETFAKHGRAYILRGMDALVEQTEQQVVAQSTPTTTNPQTTS